MKLLSNGRALAALIILGSTGLSACASMSNKERGAVVGGRPVQPWAG